MQVKDSGYWSWESNSQKSEKSFMSLSSESGTTEFLTAFKVSNVMIQFSESMS